MNLFSVANTGHTAWSTVSLQFAVGTSTGTISEDFSSESSLSIFTVSGDYGSCTPEASVSLPSFLTAVDWSEKDLIGAGLEGGRILVAPCDALSAEAMIDAHSADVTALRFSTQLAQSVLATGSQAGEVSFWDADTSALLYTTLTKSGAFPHTGRVNSISWNPRVPRVCCSAGDDGATIVWDLLKKGALMNVREDSTPVVSAVYSPDVATVISTVTAAGHVCLWDLRQKQHPLATLDLGIGPGQHVDSMRYWASYKDLLAVSLSDGTVVSVSTKDSSMHRVGGISGLGANANFSFFNPNLCLGGILSDHGYQEGVVCSFVGYPVDLAADSPTAGPAELGPVLYHPSFFLTDEWPDDLVETIVLSKPFGVRVSNTNILTSAQGGDELCLASIRDARDICERVHKMIDGHASTANQTAPSDFVALAGKPLLDAYLQAISLQDHKELVRGITRSTCESLALPSPSDGVAERLSVHSHPSPGKHMDDLNFFDSEIRNDSGSAESVELSEEHAANDCYADYSPFLYAGDLKSAIAKAVKADDFALAFCLAGLSKDSASAAAVSQLFVGKRSSAFLGLVDGCCSGRAASALSAMHLSQWREQLSLAQHYGGEPLFLSTASRLADEMALSGAAGMASTCVVLLVLARRPVDAFNLVYRHSRDIVDLALAAMRTSKACPHVFKADAYSKLLSLINILTAQGETAAVAYLQRELSIAEPAHPPLDAKAPIPQKAHQPTRPARQAAPDIFVPAQLPGLSAPPLSAVQPQRSAGFPQVAMQPPFQPPPAACVPVSAPQPAAALVAPPPSTALSPPMINLEPPPAFGMPQPAVMQPSFGQPQPARQPAAPVLVAPPPPTATGDVADQAIVQVPTTTAPQPSPVRRQPHQKIPQGGDPVQVLNSIDLNGSQLAARFLSLLARYNQVDRVGLSKHHRKLADVLVHMSEASDVLHQDTQRALNEFVAAVEQLTFERASAALKALDRRNPRVYEAEMQGWAPTLKLMARSLCAASG